MLGLPEESKTTDIETVGEGSLDLTLGFRSFTTGDFTAGESDIVYKGGENPSIMLSVSDAKTESTLSILLSLPKSKMSDPSGTYIVNSEDSLSATVTFIDKSAKADNMLGSTVYKMVYGSADVQKLKYGEAEVVLHGNAEMAAAKKSKVPFLGTISITGLPTEGEEIYFN